MNLRARGLANPVGFIMAVVGAIGVFVVALTQGPLMAIAFAAMAAALAVAFTSDEGGIWALIIAALLEGIYKCVTPSMVAMLIKDIFLAILLLRLLWLSQRNRNFVWARQPFTAAAICFAAYCTALMFAPSTRSMLLALAGLRAWLLWMPAYFPFYSYFSTTERIARFLRVLIFIMLPVSVYGIVQGNIGYAHTKILPNFYQLTRFYQSDYNPQDAQGEENGEAQFEAEFQPIMNVRACSIHISPGCFGAMCTAMLLLSIGYAAYTPNPAMRIWAIISGLAAAGGLLASGSRAPMMGLGFGVIAMVLVSQRKSALIGTIIAIVLVSVFFLRDLAGGGALRFEHRLSAAIVLERAMYPMRVGLEQGLEHPFGNGIATGIGMGRVFYKAGLENAEGTKWVENDFGRALGELGFVGASLWMLMIGGILWHCWRAIVAMGQSREGFLGAALFGGMVAIFAQLSVGSALYSAHAGMYYWIFAAAIMRTSQLLQAERAASAAAAAPAPEPQALLHTAKGPGYRPPRAGRRGPVPARPAAVAVPADEAPATEEPVEAPEPEAEPVEAEPVFKWRQPGRPLGLKRDPKTVPPRGGRR